MTRSPVVLCLSGHDPSGGAGIQADIEAIRAQGVHALSLITSLTAQDTRNVQAVEAVPLAWLQRQYALLSADCNIAAIKVGLVGNAEQAAWIAGLIHQLGVPAVVDPVLRAGGGGRLAEVEMLTPLLSAATVLTPNAAEAAALLPEIEAPADQARALQARFGNGVLVTGGDLPGEQVRNWWAGPEGERHWDWPRVSAAFHGAGCTLASSLSARLALGEPTETALHRAQGWLHLALSHGLCIGHGRLIPNRR